MQNISERIIQYYVYDEVRMLKRVLWGQLQATACHAPYHHVCSIHALFSAKRIKDLTHKHCRKERKMTAMVHAEGTSRALARLAHSMHYCA
jgi:hypothetical protein